MYFETKTFDLYGMKDQKQFIQFCKYLIPKVNELHPEASKQWMVGQNNGYYKFTLLDNCPDLLGDEILKTIKIAAENWNIL